MADYFVSASGSNTSPYDTWAKAATAFATAVAAATADGDRIIVDAANPGADVSVSTTWTFAARVSVIASTNSGTATVTPTSMGTSAWLGSSSAAVSLTLNGSVRAYFYGITFRNAGSSTNPITICSTDNGHFEFENCYLWLGNTGSLSTILFGAGTVQNCFVRLKDTTVRFGNAGQNFAMNCAFEWEGGLVASTGSSPTEMVAFGVNGQVLMEGVDLSHCGANPLFDGATNSSWRAVLSRCKLGTNYVLCSTFSPTNRATTEVWAFDCASGDAHIHLHHQNALGSTVCDTGIYYTGDDAGGVSWRITTTSAATFTHPYNTPWIDRYNATLSAMTPYFEVLRDGSTTAYLDDEVWAEFSVKTFVASPRSAFFRDRRGLAAAAAGQAAGAGTSAWTGESANAWSGKCGLNSTVTPVEVGDIRGRLCVGAASVTVYMSPQIRT